MVIRGEIEHVAPFSRGSDTAVRKAFNTRIQSKILAKKQAAVGRSTRAGTRRIRDGKWV